MTSLKIIRRALPVLAALFALSITAPAFAQSTMAPSTMAPSKPVKVKKSKKTAAATTATTAAAPAAAGGGMMSSMKSKMASKTSTGKSGGGRFTSETEAKASCPTDTVVWASSKSKAYHLAGSKLYGNTKSGAYECKSVADSAGYHAAKN